MFERVNFQHSPNLFTRNISYVKLLALTFYVRIFVSIWAQETVISVKITRTEKLCIFRFFFFFISKFQFCWMWNILNCRKLCASVDSRSFGASTSITKMSSARTLLINCSWNSGLINRIILFTESLGSRCIGRTCKYLDVTCGNRRAFKFISRQPSNVKRERGRKRRRRRTVIQCAISFERMKKNVKKTIKRCQSGFWWRY